MSAYQTYELHCDGESCHATFNAAERTAFATRKEAAKQRWTHTTIPPEPPRQMARPVDYCPDCSPKETTNG